MKRHQALLGCMALALPSAASAGIVSIDFETIAHNEILDNQFVDLGIDFGGTMVVFNSPTQSNSGVKEAFGPPFGTIPTRIESVGAEFDTLIAEYLEHYHTERPHQGIGNRTIQNRRSPRATGKIECRTRLGGVLRHYQRAA